MWSSFWTFRKCLPLSTMDPLLIVISKPQSAPINKKFGFLILKELSNTSEHSRIPEGIGSKVQICASNFGGGWAFLFCRQTNAQWKKAQHRTRKFWNGACLLLLHGVWSHYISDKSYATYATFLIPFHRGNKVNFRKQAFSGLCNLENYNLSSHAQWKFQLIEPIP